MDKYVNFSELLGLTLKRVSVVNYGKTGFDNEDRIVFETVDAEEFQMLHEPECCESVYIEEIIGDLDDLIGTPILLAEEVESTDPDESTIASRKADYEKSKAKALVRGIEFYESKYSPNPTNDWKEESETWTFYKLSTIKGSVTIRWYGSSNGYYSESVYFVKKEKRI